MGIIILSLKNESANSKAIIIEPFHFVEEIEPNDNLVIHFGSMKHKEKPFFDIAIRDYEIFVEFDYEINQEVKNSIMIYINDKLVNKFEW